MELVQYYQITTPYNFYPQQLNIFYQLLIKDYKFTTKPTTAIIILLNQLLFKI